MYDRGQTNAKSHNNCKYTRYYTNIRMWYSRFWQDFVQAFLNITERCCVKSIKYIIYAIIHVGVVHGYPAGNFCTKTS